MKKRHWFFAFLLSFFGSEIRMTFSRSGEGLDTVVLDKYEEAILDMGTRHISKPDYLLKRYGAVLQQAATNFLSSK